MFFRTLVQRQYQLSFPPSHFQLLHRRRVICRQLIIMSSPSAPPAKRLKSDFIPTSDMAAEMEVTEAPVKALFTPEASSSKSAPAPKVKGKKARKQKRPIPESYSPADVMFHDVRDFLGVDLVRSTLDKKDGSEWESPEDLGLFETVEVTAGAFTVSGESLSLWSNEKSKSKSWAIITPFAHPGDKIKAKIYKHDRLCSYADLVEILEYSEEYRGGEGDRRKYPSNGCKYFGECGGCQLQPLPYSLQLSHKKRTVQLAYERFSTLLSGDVPTIQETIGSPKQWGYRTKITPHFDAPPKWARPKIAEVKEEDAMNDVVEDEEKTETKKFECRIGFERKGKPGVMDIEECPIATKVLNDKMVHERRRIQETIMSFKKGATLLLRDSLPAPEPIPNTLHPYSPETPVEDETHIAITNHRESVYERVGPFIFSFAAGSFFQNNNSILIPLTQYVQEAIFPPSVQSSSSMVKKVPTHLVDTYCGSGLFGITLSPKFKKVAGVEISQDSITAAKRNAEMNGLQDKTEWLCGKAEDIFGGLAEKGFAGEHSCVVVDPPRKGCDTPFLDQLLSFKPLTIVYVSCNVHTQARDVGYLIHESVKRGEGQWKYTLESLRGFDLFPQTAHVESVAVLRLHQ